MPPQPLSKFRKQYHGLVIAWSAGRERPELGSLATQIIALWANIEGSLANLLMNMLGADQKPALAMFTAINSVAAQQAALRAAAGSVLAPADVEIFETTLKLINSSNADRNRFAHWKWGYLAGIDDALVLVDPEYSRQWEELGLLIKAAGGSLVNGPLPPSIDHVLVYRKRDIIAAVDRLLWAQRLCGHLTEFVATRGQGEAERMWLTTEPEVHEALSLRRSRAKKSRPIPKQPRRKSPSGKK